MFVRTKKVGDKRYNQLVENYRENGQHKQRVLAHLGKHETPQAALEALRAKLDEYQRGDLARKYNEARRQARWYKQDLEVEHADALKRWHGGELPSSTEFKKRAGEDTFADYSDEVDYWYMGSPSFKYEQRERTPEQVEYNRSFANGEEQPVEKPTIYGYMSIFPGVFDVTRNVESYEYWVREAVRLEAEYEQGETKLKERIAKLEAVVTKA